MVMRLIFRLKWSSVSNAPNEQKDESFLWKANFANYLIYETARIKRH